MVPFLLLQLSDFLVPPLQKAGGMLALVDVYCLFNRARGTGGEIGTNAIPVHAQPITNMDIDKEHQFMCGCKEGAALVVWCDVMFDSSTPPLLQSSSRQRTFSRRASWQSRSKREGKSGTHSRCLF